MVIADTKQQPSPPPKKKNVNQSFVKTYQILIIYYFAFKYNYVTTHVTNVLP